MGRLYCSRPYCEARLTCSNMIDSIARLMPVVGASLLTLSILFSPTLRLGLSYHHLLFLGSVSFSMYLLHATMMRTLLAWVLYGLLPLPLQAEMVERDESNSQIAEISVSLRFMWSIVEATVFILWMGLLIRVSAIWRNRVDSYSINLAKWLEQVMAGNKV